MLRNFLIKAITWVFYGNLEGFGFSKGPSPATAPFAINGNFIETLASGMVNVRPKLAKIIAPNTVEFVDGSTLDGIDAIIMATGYRPDYGFCTAQGLLI